jgi:hypothetical protein
MCHEGFMRKLIGFAAVCVGLGAVSACDDSGKPVDTSVIDATVPFPVDSGQSPMTTDSADPLPPSTGTFPAVSDLSAAGPYEVMTLEKTGPNANYTVFRPTELAPGGVLSPVVSWGNGGGTTPALYPLLPHLASHGFVVVASNNTTVTGPEVKAGLDWVFEQNQDAQSAFYGKLDAERVAGVGYSFGGLATLANSDDPRYDTIVIVSGGSMEANRAANVAKVRTPAAYFCTDDDASEGNCMGDYDVLTVPIFFGVINGSEHVGVVVDNDVRTRLNVAVLAWFRWFLMDDESQRGRFLGESCGLCQDSAWTVFPTKNWP